MTTTSLIPASIWVVATVALLAALGYGITYLHLHRMSRRLRKRFGGSFSPTGYHFSVDGRSCRLRPMRHGILLEIDLAGPHSSITIHPVSAKSVRPDQPGRRRIILQTGALEIHGSDPQALERILATDGFAEVMSELFDPEELHGKRLTLGRQPGVWGGTRGISVLLYSAFLWDQPDRLIGLVRHLDYYFGKAASGDSPWPGNSGVREKRE